MYGLVNAAVQDLVTSKFGKDKWEAIKAKVGLDVSSFSRMDAYPDELTYKLVGATSEVLGITPEDALKAFGEFWVLYTGTAGYGDIMDMAGGNLREFLFNLDNLHTRVGQSFPKLRPPSFRFEVIDDDVLRMHYHTAREGLCPMVVGLLTGLAKRFESSLDINHDRCKKNGAEHCEFLLTLGGGEPG
jgi:hypothetical protein